MLFVKVIPRFSLIDGKVLSHITETPSCSRCAICYAPPKSLNDYENWLHNKDFKISEVAMLAGFSQLHLIMRILGHLVNLGCRQHIDKHKSQARGEDAKKAKAMKRTIQARFREKFNMRVDEPSSKGGTTTTGNVARKAFSQPKLLAEILQLDEKMVVNLSLLLSAVSSHHRINIEEFDKLVTETREIYVSKYGNIPMSATLHKLLIHGVDIIKASILPTGYFNEEAAEAKNKHYRLDRIFHARKTSRTDNITDVLRRSLAMSDPYISSRSDAERKKWKKIKPISTELSNLLIIEKMDIGNEDLEGDRVEDQNDDSDEEEEEGESLEFFWDDNDYFIIND